MSAAPFDVLQDRLDLGDNFIGPVRSTEESGQAISHHAVEPPVFDKARVEQDDHIWVNRAEMVECLLAVHQGHGEIEQDEREPARVFPEKIKSFKTRLGGDHGKASLRENLLQEDECHGLIIHDHDTARDVQGG